MAGVLQLSLLGKLQISRDHTVVTGFVSTKVQALLCYLAVTARPHDRQTLAGLLWGEMAETEAKANLRTALFNLRKMVGSHLIVTRQTVTFDQASPHTLDVADFQTALAAAGLLDQEPSPAALSSATGPILLPPLRQAAELYRGDFLEGFSVRDAPAFEEWLLGQQERLRLLASQTLYTLAVQHTARGEYAAGIDYTTRLLTLEPWHEEGQRQMMTLLIRSGQRSAALAQYETCRRILAEELGVEPAAETTALYKRLKAAGTPSPHNLPPQTTPFIGRQPELAHIADRLDNPNCRLLSLIGQGGVGKTRLAVQAAATQVAQSGFQDGVFLINLAAVNSVELFLTHLAAALTALNLPAGDPAALKPQLLAHLEAKEILLLLDNFEQLLGQATAAVDLLPELLRAAPRLKLLVTSRERLNLREEWALDVAGLNYPASTAGPEAEAVDNEGPFEGYSAVALFVQQAQQVQAGFTLSEADWPAVARICRLVEGAPLGLELAASWLPLYTCPEIAAEIERNLDFLTTSRRNVPERHRSLRAVFEHSWALLSPPEQAIFRQLSVFRGGFEREAALQVSQASPVSLAGLLTKSLLRHTTPGRYEIHELLRQYAAEKLAQTPVEQQAVQTRHARYYANFLRQWRQQFERDKSSAALAKLNAETDNLRLGWQRAIESEQAEAEINQYWYFGAIEPAGSLFGPNLAWLRPPDPGWDQGLERHGQGLLAYRQGHYPTAKQYLLESLALLQTADDALYIARSKAVLGMLAYDLGDNAEAEQLLQESLVVLKAQGEHRYRSYGLAYLGRVTPSLGRPVEVEAALRESLAISREVEDHWAIAHTLKNLGAMLDLTAQTVETRREAQALLEESLVLCRDNGDPWSIAAALVALGQVHQHLADDQAATRCYREALALALPPSFTPLVLQILVGLARQETPERALTLLSVVVNHPACPRPLQAQAAALLAEVEAHAPADIVETARQQAATLGLEAVVGLPPLASGL